MTLKKRPPRKALPAHATTMSFLVECFIMLPILRLASESEKKEKSSNPPNLSMSTLRLETDANFRTSARTLAGEKSLTSAHSKITLSSPRALYEYGGLDWHFYPRSICSRHN